MKKRLVVATVLKYALKEDQWNGDMSLPLDRGVLDVQ